MGAELGIGALGSLVATLVWVASAGLYYRYRNQRPFARLFSFNRSRKVVFVFPGRLGGPGNKGLIQNARISFEDMLAANYLQRCLSLAGWSPEMVEMREDRAFLANSQDAEDNLVILCSPKSNSVTEQLLRKVDERHGLKWSFEKKPNDEMEIHTNGGHWESATYAQAASITAAGGRVADGALDDVAMIVKAANPHNAAASIFIVAGVRGIGTWGAAYYLRQNAQSLSARTKGRPFAVLLKVHYNAWRIESIEEAVPPFVLT